MNFSSDSPIFFSWVGARIFGSHPWIFILFRQIYIKGGSQNFWPPPIWKILSKIPSIFNLLKKIGNALKNIIRTTLQALAPKHCKHKFTRVRGDRHWESPSFSPSLRHQLLQRGLITGYSVWELNTIIWKPCANCKRIRVSLNGVFRLSQGCLKGVLRVS